MGTLHQKPTRIQYKERRIAHIRIYINTEKEEESDQIEISTYRNHRQSTRKRKTRNIEEEAEKLQKSEDQNNAKQIWEYRSKLRIATSAQMLQRRRPVGKNANVWKYAANGPKNASGRKNKQKPQIEHIRDLEWGDEIQTAESLKKLRKQARLPRIITAEPDTGTWFNQEYTEKDIDVDLRNLANRKAHWGDGIPGAEYKETRKWAVRPITGIMNKIENGQQIPAHWASGTIV